MSSVPPSSPSPFLSRFWPMLVLLLAAVGVPAAAITVFSHFITDHPLLALGIALLYEVGVFILGFLGKVWQKLES
jgi:Sec-independent protein secretion pathway component TatC